MSIKAGHAILADDPYDCVGGAGPGKPGTILWLQL